MRGDERPRGVEEPNAARSEPLELGDPALDPVEAFADVEPTDCDVLRPEKPQRVPGSQDGGGVGCPLGVAVVNRR